MLVFSALGAFIMGSIIAETTQAEHIEHLVKPVKDLFAAVFSCRLVCLSILILCTLMPGRILTLVVIFGQSISSIIGALISGRQSNRSK
jgi:CPA2 family monovalent cation:H+ antiporter-2